MLMTLSWGELTMSIENIPFWRGDHSSDPSLRDIQFTSETICLTLFHKSRDLLQLNIHFQVEFCISEKKILRSWESDIWYIPKEWSAFINFCVKWWFWHFPIEKKKNKIIKFTILFHSSQSNLLYPILRDIHINL